MTPGIKNFSGGIISTDWVEVGFQGEDPSTDFRGTGRLGYVNLLYLVNVYTEKARRMLAIARDVKTEFFFACAAINVTFHLKKLLKSRQDLRLFLGGARTRDGVIFRFNELFCRVFEEFVNFWHRHPNNDSFMNFNTVMVGLQVIAD